MNQDAIDFFERIGIDKDVLSALDGSYIYEAKEINTLTSKNAFHDKQIPAKISIANIVGYDRFGREIPSNLFDSFRFYFDSNASTYQQRSLGLLSYSTEEIIKQLQDVASDEIEGRLHRSFESEPIVVQEIDKDKYVISDNGLHRFTVLKTHYLKELSKIIVDREKIEELNNKFTVPVMLSKLDYIKTYSKALLVLSSSIVSARSEIDAHYKLTGRVCIKDKEANSFAFNDEQLLEYTNQRMETVLDNEYFLELIEFYSSKYETFREFVSEHVPVLSTELNKKAGVK